MLCKYLSTVVRYIENLMQGWRKIGVVFFARGILYVTPWILRLMHCNSTMYQHINTLRPKLNGRYFVDDISKCIFLNENIWISFKSSVKFVSKFVQMNNVPALVQIMAWRESGDKPLFEPKMVSLLTCICVTRPQWFQSPFWWMHTNLHVNTLC